VVGLRRRVDGTNTRCSKPSCSPLRSAPLSSSSLKRPANGRWLDGLWLRRAGMLYCKLIDVTTRTPDRRRASTRVAARSERVMILAAGAALKTRVDPGAISRELER